MDGQQTRLCTEVFSDPIYLNTVVNTMIFLAFGVNLKLFLALMLSGFFMRPGWWTKALLLIFVLPWAVPALPTFISIHWMLNGEWGLVNNFLYIVFGIDGPSWLNSRWLALGSAICSHVWKWTPFWTVILLAGRMSIPQEIYDAAKVDGATGLRGFTHVTFPLLANLYLVLTLLATIFLLGRLQLGLFRHRRRPGQLDASAGDARRSPRHAFELGKPQLGVAAVMSALPLLIPLVIILMRKLRDCGGAAVSTITGRHEPATVAAASAAAGRSGCGARRGAGATRDQRRSRVAQRSSCWCGR